MLKTICWNIFDYTDAPEPLWNLQRQGKHRAAALAAVRLTLLHPITMIPVIIRRLR